MSENANRPGPWFIGGAGRSGKTTLANVLAAHSATVAGFPLEGVFHVYLQRSFPFFRQQRERLLNEYLKRPRYMDAERSRVEYPTDHFDVDTQSIANEIPDTVDHPIRLFGWLLDRFAASRGKQTWAVFDLLPELRYATYRKLLPGARLVVMRRDPAEAIAEGMFWRSYPDAPPNRARRFKAMLFQWSLSRAVTDAHKRRFGGDVVEFAFSRLVTGDTQELGRLADTFDMDPAAVRGAFDFKPGYEHHTDKGFLGPDGTWRPLLSPDELDHIAAAENGKIRYPSLRISLALAPFAPNLARSLGDFVLDPRTVAVRRLNALRQRAADAVAGLRARRHN